MRIKLAAIVIVSLPLLVEFFFIFFFNFFYYHSFNFFARLYLFFGIFCLFFFFRFNDILSLFRFGLVSLCNDMSTFMGYLMPKPCLYQ